MTDRQHQGASSPSAPTALSPSVEPLRVSPAAPLRSAGAGDLLERFGPRNEAYGRMIAATQEGNDAAYLEARADFWRFSK